MMGLERTPALTEPRWKERSAKLTSPDPTWGFREKLLCRAEDPEIAATDRFWLCHTDTSLRFLLK